MHTKGEWTLQPAKINDGVKYWGILNDRVENKYCVGFFYTYSGIPYSEAQANAQLIVSAPEMLQALEESREALTKASLIDKTNTCDKALKVVEAAIQKAKGESA